LPGTNDPLATPRPPAFGLPPQAQARLAIEFSSNRGRTIAVYVCLALSILSLVAMISTIGTQRELLERVQKLQTGAANPTEALDLLSEVRENDDKVDSANGGAVIMFIATAVAFGFWIHRAYKNLYALNANTPPSNPAFAVWSVLIPVANTFLGFQRLKEIWQASGTGRTGREDEATDRRSVPVPWFVWAWWIGFAVLLIARFILGLSRPKDGGAPGAIDRLYNYDAMAILVSMAGIVLAALGAYAVMRITRRQRDAYALLQTVEPQVVAANLA
jgi:hypothetical protein